MYMFYTTDAEMKPDSETGEAGENQSRLLTNIVESKKDCKLLLSQEAGGSDFSEQSFRSLNRAPED